MTRIEEYVSDILSAVEAHLIVEGVYDGEPEFGYYDEEGMKAEIKDIIQEAVLRLR
jgi:hypothetical protein